MSFERPRSDWRYRTLGGLGVPIRETPQQGSRSTVGIEQQRQDNGTENHIDYRLSVAKAPEVVQEAQWNRNGRPTHGGTPERELHATCIAAVPRAGRFAS